MIRRRALALFIAANLSAVALPLSGQATAVVAPRSDTIVKLAGPPIHQGVARIVGEIAIGSAQGTADYELSAVAEVVSGPAKSVYVYDSKIPIIRQYDSTGRFMRALGRRGQGPGEYVNARGLAVLPDGRLLIHDAGNGRINVYSPGGAPIDSWRVGAVQSGSSWYTGASGALTVDPAGIVYLSVRLADNAPRGRAATSMLSVVHAGYMRLRIDGRILDTIAPPVMNDSSPMMYAERVSGTSTRSSGAGVPFSISSYRALSPNGYFVTGRSARYAFELRVPPAPSPLSRAAGPETSTQPAVWREGDPVISIRRTVSPIAVSSAERDAWRAHIETRLRELDPAWTWNGPEMPRVKPAYGSITIGRDGTIWVGVTPPTGASLPVRPADALSEFDVFEPAGTYIGRVAIPVALEIHDRTRTGFWGVELDKDDIPTARRYRIVWP